MALNTWAAKNLGPDADISRMPSAGGGGGSSDFSTAEVTFAGTGAEYFYCPVMLDGYLSCGVTFGSQINESRKYTVVFTTDGNVDMVLREATVSAITGDASYDEDNNAIYIWGDCTITIDDRPSA